MQEDEMNKRKHKVEFQELLNKLQKVYLIDNLNIKNLEVWFDAKLDEIKQELTQHVKPAEIKPVVIPKPTFLPSASPSYCSPQLDKEIIKYMKNELNCYFLRRKQEKQYILKVQALLNGKTIEEVEKLFPPISSWKDVNEKKEVTDGKNTQV